MLNIILNIVEIFCCEPCYFDRCFHYATAFNLGHHSNLQR